MKIAIIGYGKMGKMIETIGLERGHTFPIKINSSNRELIQDLSLDMVDAAIEFTQPTSAISNYKALIDKQIPVITGTTGWHDEEESMFNYINDRKGSFFHASNFSIGVNIFFQINKQLAKLMSHQSEFDIRMEEVHHLEKKDSPSGTAITIANQIIKHHDHKSSWSLDQSDNYSQIPIQAKREEGVFGNHSVTYTSQNDKLQISHQALSRSGFALGAILAAEWMSNKPGIFTMEDMLQQS